MDSVKLTFADLESFFCVWGKRLVHHGSSLKCNRYVATSGLESHLQYFVAAFN